jgi:Flp pilus assembly protein TadD
VVRSALSDPDPLLRYGALLALDDQPPAVLRALALPMVTDEARAVRLEAARLVAALPRSSLDAADAETAARAMGDFEEAVRLDADRPGAWTELGDIRATRGQRDAAFDAYRTALTLDSTYLPAHLNLAELYRALGDDPMEERTLGIALEVQPDAPEAQHAVGLKRVRDGDLGAALVHLERASRDAPENARFAYVYGVAIGSSGDLAGAISVLRTSLERHPYSEELLSALAAYHRDLGETAEALAYAMRLAELRPDDLDVRALVRTLGGDPGRRPNRAPAPTLPA